VPVVMMHWRLESLEGLDSGGERARDPFWLDGPVEAGRGAHGCAVL
jgi:hypothetical protein